MTVTVANTANTNTFDYWRVRTNELADAMSNKAVTVESTAAVGNAAITGTFTANVLIVNTFTVNSSFSVGNSTVNAVVNSTSIIVGNSTINTVIGASSVKLSNTSSNLNVSIPTASQYSNGQYYLNANGSWSLIVTSYNPASNGQTNTSGTSTQEIDNYTKASYFAAEYVVNIKDDNSNNFAVTKIVTYHDTNLAYMTEYASMYSNASVGTFSITNNTTHVRLLFAPVSSNTTVKFARVIV